MTADAMKEIVLALKSPLDSSFVLQLQTRQSCQLRSPPNTMGLKGYNGVCGFTVGLVGEPPKLTAPSGPNCREFVAERIA